MNERCIGAQTWLRITPAWCRGCNFPTAPVAYLFDRTSGTCGRGGTTMISLSGKLVEFWGSLESWNYRQRHKLAFHIDRCNIVIRGSEFVFSYRPIKLHLRVRLAMLMRWRHAKSTRIQRGTTCGVIDFWTSCSDWQDGRGARSISSIWSAERQLGTSRWRTAGWVWAVPVCFELKPRWTAPETQKHKISSRCRGFLGRLIRDRLIA